MDSNIGNEALKDKNVPIVFFAKARELAGVNRSIISVNRALSYTQLAGKVIKQFGLESIGDTLIIAVNEEFLERDAVLDLTEHDEIAVIPPLSGDAIADLRKNCDRVEIDQSQVQIRADNDELERRIESFIARKRQQVNAVNVQEFCSHRYLSDENEGSCARVDAILIRRKDSKSHVKVHRVLNSRGPQTMDPLMLFAETNKSCGRDTSENHTGEYPVLDERLSATEKFLGINKPVPKDIYERIKSIENRVLHLESLSPEYKDFWVTESTDDLMSLPCKPVRKRRPPRGSMLMNFGFLIEEALWNINNNEEATCKTYSTAELDSKLIELEDRYAKNKSLLAK